MRSLAHTSRAWTPPLNKASGKALDNVIRPTSFANSVFYLSRLSTPPRPCAFCLCAQLAIGYRYISSYTFSTVLLADAALAGQKLQAACKGYVLHTARVFYSTVLDFPCYCRAVQDKCSQLESALKEYTSWQTLPPHEALSKVNTVRSSLQQASKATLNLDTPTKLSNITFEMPNFNTLSSLEHLGRLKVETSTSAVCTLSNGSTKHGNLVGDDEPPAKRKKEV